MNNITFSMQFYYFVTLSRQKKTSHICRIHVHVFHTLKKSLSIDELKGDRKEHNAESLSLFSSLSKSFKSRLEEDTCVRILRFLVAFRFLVMERLIEEVGLV